MNIAPHRGVKRYFRRLRLVLLGTFLAFGAGAALTWYYREAIFALLTAPAGGLLSPHDGYPVFTSPTEVLSATIRLSLTGGIVTAFPVAVLSVFHVVSPILTQRDRRIAAVFLPAIIGFYLLGVAFTYFVMLPTGVRFLLHFGDGVAVPTIRISEYMNLVMTLMIWLGVIFEIPLVMFFLVKVRMLSYERLKRLRRYLLLAAPFLSIFITPTFDPLNMLLVFVPIVVLYEVGLLLAWLAQPGKGGVMLHAIPRFLLWLYRAVVMLLLLPFAFLVGVLYEAARLFVAEWDEHLSVEDPSAGVQRLNRWRKKADHLLEWPLFRRQKE